MATTTAAASSDTTLKGRQFGIELDLGRIGPAVGSEIVARLREAVLTHGFVVLRDQRFTDAELKALGRQFGAIDDRVIKYSSVGPVEIKDATLWHHHSNCDGALDDLILYYTPAVPGPSEGTIEFFDSTAWLGALTPADREWARRRKARHDYRSVAHAGIPPIANPEWQPMVTRREAAGVVQEAFYLGDHAVEIEGVDDVGKSSPATPFGRIRKLAEDARLYHVHEARAHDLILWDLRMVAHRSRPWESRTLRVIHEVIVRRIA